MILKNFIFHYRPSLQQTSKCLHFSFQQGLQKSTPVPMKSASLFPCTCSEPLPHCTLCYCRFPRQTIDSSQLCFSSSSPPTSNIPLATFQASPDVLFLSLATPVLSAAWMATHLRNTPSSCLSFQAYKVAVHLDNTGQEELLKVGKSNGAIAVLKTHDDSLKLWGHSSNTSI